MHVLMVTDAYPPMRTSCAVQMHDLARAFISEGHQVTIITPTSTQKERVQITHNDGVRLMQVKAFETKDINYISRTLAEFFNPFLIWCKLKLCPEFINTKYHCVIWYSPTIFWGPLIKRLKQQFNVKAYLILRDIFPDWALNLGLIKVGFAYRFLKTVERFQYQQADIIGVQSPNNLSYFKGNYSTFINKVEILWNWIGDEKNYTNPFAVNLKKFTGRFIFTYIGNMGVAQNMNLIINLAERFQNNTTLSHKVGFLLVGRGSEVKRLKKLSETKQLTNILFLDEVSRECIPGILRKCNAGLVCLDPLLKSHNIPGKFLSYLKEGLPVLAAVNIGNDLIDLISEYDVGEVIIGDNISEYEEKAIKLFNKINDCEDYLEIINSNLLVLFTTKRAVSSIINSLNISPA
jgi:glycosyltransferase involved in cell wall biosynthesis